MKEETYEFRERLVVNGVTPETRKHPVMRRHDSINSRY